MNIPFLDLKQSYNNIKDEINNSIQCVLDKGNYILGEEVIEFENNYFCENQRYFFHFVKVSHHIFEAYREIFRRSAKT